MRADGEEVSGAQRAVGAFGEVGLRDFFNDGLGHRVLPALTNSRFLASLGMTNLRAQVKSKHCKQCFYGRFLLFAFVAAGFFVRTSAFMRAISLLTDPVFSRPQMASFSFFWAFGDSTPSASAANFSSTS